MMLTVLGHARVQVVVEACSSEARLATVTHKAHDEAVALQQALLHIPSPDSEYSMRNVASRLGSQLAEQVRASLIVCYLRSLLHYVCYKFFLFSI